MQEREACAGCRFFQPTDTYSPNYDPYFGVCKRHAPVANVRNGVDGFPTVMSNDWCGDFEASGQNVAEGEQLYRFEGIEAVPVHPSAPRWQKKADNSTSLKAHAADPAINYLLANLHRVTGAQVRPAELWKGINKGWGDPEAIIFWLEDG